MEFNKPKFCTYCGKDLTKYLLVMENMLRCPYCGEKLFHMEREFKKYLDKQTAPKSKKSKSSNMSTVAQNKIVREVTLRVLLKKHPTSISKSRLLGHIRGIPAKVIHPIWDTMVEEGVLIKRKKGRKPYLSLSFNSGTVIDPTIEKKPGQANESTKTKVWILGDKV